MTSERYNTVNSLTSTKQSAIDLERRVFCGGSDKLDPTFFNIRK